MDQTDLAMLAGVSIGFPAGTFALHELFALPWWGSGLLAVPLGLVPVAALTFVVVGWLGRRSERADAEPDASRAGEGERSSEDG